MRSASNLLVGLPAVSRTLLGRLLFFGSPGLAAGLLVTTFLLEPVFWGSQGIATHFATVFGWLLAAGGSAAGAEIFLAASPASPKKDFPVARGAIFGTLIYYGTVTAADSLLGLR